MSSVTHPLSAAETPQPVICPDQPAARSAAFAGVWEAVWIGLAITLGQITFVTLLAGNPNLKAAYHELLRGDSGWYYSIISGGYRTPIPPVPQQSTVSNVAFFPGYPLWCHGVIKLFGVSVDHGMLIAAQLAAWGFWTHVLLFLRRWQLPTVWCVFTVISILVHPAAFILIAGMSESLFLFATLGFLYWASAPGRSSVLLSSAYGFAMTATRIVGIPIAAYPVVCTLLSAGTGKGARWMTRRLVVTAGVGMVAILGAASFFAYCQYRWGVWDLYFQTQRIGWGNHADLGAFFRGKNYVFSLTTDWDVTVNALQLCRFCCPLYLGIFGVILLLEGFAAWVGAEGWRQRLGLYFAAWMMFYMSVCGSVNAGWPMMSLIRYSLCPHVLLMISLGYLLASVAPRLRWRAVWGPILSLALMFFWSVSFAVGVMLAYRWVHGGWI